MIRSPIASCCIFLLLGQGFGQTPAPPIQAQLARFRTNENLTVKLRTGEIWKGKLLSLGLDSFEFQPEKKTVFSSTPEPVTLAYRDVQSVRRSGHKTLIVTLIVVGAIVAAMAISVGLHYDT